MKNETYRIELRCKTGDVNNYYTFLVPFTDGVSPYIYLTYNSTTSCAVSSSNGGSSWSVDYGRDAPFRLWIPVAPGKITDLTASSSDNEGEVKLSWTAPGDDGYTGTAQQYQVKYATFPIITESDWNNLNTYLYTGSLPTPLPAGTTQQVVLTGLPKGINNGWYYFNIRARDDNPADTPFYLCASPPSNNAIAQVREIQPIVITSLVATSITALPLPQGASVQLNWTAPGDDYTEGTADKYTIKYSTWIYEQNQYVYRTVSYMWLDGLTNATIVADGDDLSTQVNLPFEFNFYGINYSSMYICSNGFISFTDASSAYSNTDIPNSEVPNSLIAALWDDLNPSASGSGKIYYKKSEGKVIITYNGVYRYGTTQPQYFQIVLYEDGTIRINYNQLTQETTTSATVGVENQTGNIGKRYRYDTSGEPLYNNLSIEFFNGIDIKNAT